MYDYLQYILCRICLLCGCHQWYYIFYVCVLCNIHLCDNVWLCMWRDIYIVTTLYLLSFIFYIYLLYISFGKGRMSAKKRAWTKTTWTGGKKRTGGLSCRLLLIAFSFSFFFSIFLYKEKKKRRRRKHDIWHGYTIFCYSYVYVCGGKHDIIWEGGGGGSYL